MAKEREAKIKFTAEVGSFNKSINKAESELKVLRSELKLNETQMKNTGESAEGLQKSQQILTEQLEAAKDKTEALRGKLDKAIEIYGEGSSVVANYKRAVANARIEEENITKKLADCTEKLKQQAEAATNATSATDKLTDKIEEQQTELNQLKKRYADLVAEEKQNTEEAKDLASQINKLSGELKENKTAFSNAEKAADKLDQSLDDVADGAKEAEGGFTVLDGAVSVFIGNGLTSLVDGLGNAISSFANLSQETQEYREDIGKLKTAWESAGKSTELATSVYKEFYSVLGEEDRSVEAVNHLAKFVETEEDMAKWTDICAGVWGTFGDSLPVEGLTEASNETAKVGKLTGVLADALNWAGVNEEKFQKKLDKCNDEQERAELITETLNDLYVEAADNYKENNKNIIEARKATSKYTDTMADLGEAIEPVNTEITELKTEFAKELTPVVKKSVIPAIKGFIDELKKSGTITNFSNIIGNLAKTILPPLASVLGFICENFGTLVTVVGTAVITFKTFSAVMAIANTITACKTAVEGLTVGVGLATKAQTLWNAAMSANPIGAIITAIGLLVGGIALLVSSQNEAKTSTDLLNESQREALNTAREAATALDEQRTATEQSAGAISSSMSYVTNLADELFRLAGESGKVKEADEARVKFILNELNEALGTEYSLVDGVVQKYQNLKKSVYEVIEAKTASALLENANADYTAAIEKERTLMDGVNASYEEYQAQLTNSQTKIAEYTTKKEEAEAKLDALGENGNRRLKDMYEGQVSSYTQLIKNENKLVEDKKTAYEADVKNYAENQVLIDNYREAMIAAEEGNYDRVVEILNGKSVAYNDYGDDVDKETQKVLDTLYNEAIQAGIEAKRTKNNFEKGVKGYTKEMVKESEDAYDEAMGEWEDAYNEAHGIGGDMGDGLKQGLESKRTSLLAKARNLISTIWNAMRKEADSHSPSRKTMQLGGDMGDGLEIGLDRSTDDVVKSSQKMVEEGLKPIQVGVTAKIGDITTPLNSLNKEIGGNTDLVVQKQIHSNATQTVEHKLQNSGLLPLMQAVADLANRPIKLNINGREFAVATASDTDSVNGLRSVFKSRGLAVE